MDEEIDCMYIRDSFNQYLINVAMDEGIGSYIIDQMIEKMSTEQNCPVLHVVAAEHGLKWSRYTRKLAESNVDEVVNGIDNMTGLHLFMLAPMGNHSDLSAIYDMMRMSP